MASDAHFKIAMERAKWHWEVSQWYYRKGIHSGKEFCRFIKPDEVRTANASAKHHQFHAARLYAEARAIRDAATDRGGVESVQGNP